MSYTVMRSYWHTVHKQGTAALFFCRLHANRQRLPCPSLTSSEFSMRHFASTAYPLVRLSRLEIPFDTSKR